MSRVPRIRFKGFEEDWEQRKLGEVANIVGGGTPSTSNEKYWDGNIDWYAPAEIGEQIYAFWSIRKITEEGLKHSSAKLLPAFKTVLFTSRAGIGNMAVLQKDGATNQGFQSIVCNDCLVPYFVFSMGFQIKKKAERVAAGSTFSEISGKQLCDLEIMVTTDKEQLKIGSYFQSLDHLITLHQRKLEKLKIIKKSMLENLFPKNGENTPRIRFSGFTEDWEQRKLSSLCDKFTDGDWIEAKDQSNSGVRLIQTGNVGVAEYLDKPNNKKWISNDTFEALNCEEVFEGDILISRLPEPAGRACIIPKLASKMVTAVDCTIVRVSNDTSNKYLLQYLSSQKYFDEVNTCLAGGTRQRISRSGLANFDVAIPVKKSEQEAIGAYFSNLDHLITLHQSKLEKLQKIKKSMLESMFV